MQAHRTIILTVAGAVIGGAVLTIAVVTSAIGQGGPIGQGGQEPPEKQAFEAAEEARQAAAEKAPQAPAHPEITPAIVPTPTPFIAGPEVRPCNASDLNAAVIGSNAATGGQLLAGIGLGNKSTEPCRLSGPPNIQLIDPEGHVIPLDTFQSSPCSTTVSSPCIFPEPLLMLANLGELKPHTAVPGQAGLEITWWASDFNDPTGTCSPPPPVATAVRLSLPEGGGELRVDLTPEFPAGIRPCHSRVGIFGFSGIPPKPTS